MFFRLKNNRGIIFISFNLRGTNLGATAAYPATIVLDYTYAHIFKERETYRNKLSQEAGYSAVTNLLHIQDFVAWSSLLPSCLISQCIFPKLKYS